MSSRSACLETIFEKALAALAETTDESGSKLTASQFLDYVNAAAQKVAQEKFVQVSNETSPKKKPIRGYLDGCFDIMHSGHYNAIRQAKSLCDILVVGVHSDEEIAHHKGPPVMNNEERLATVRGCKWVDEVAFDTPYNPSLELLDKLNCDFCFHGDDTATTADGRDAYEEIKSAGRMKIIKRTEGVSTTDLVGRLLLMTRDHHLPDQATQASASPSASQQSKPEEAKHYSAGISNFLPTTWRISQFANNRQPKKDDVVVYIDGAFDLFHIGHIETLEKAKKLGSFLYVGLHDDATVNFYKGHNYPIMNLHERVLNVLSCKYVDEVIIGAPWKITKDMIVSLNIKVVVEGSTTKLDKELTRQRKQSGAEEHELAALEEDPYAVAKEMGIYHQIDSSRSLQTDDVVHRIIENRQRYQNRNKTRSAKDLKYLENKQFVEEI